jgi:hypothetical protein
MIETCWSDFKCFNVWHLNWGFITNKCISWTFTRSPLYTSWIQVNFQSLCNLYTTGRGSSGELHSLGKETLNKTLCGPQEQFDALVKGRAIQLQAWTGPLDCRRLTLPEFPDSRHMKVVRLSALRTGRLYPLGDSPGTHLCERLSQHQGHSAAGRIMSMKTFKRTIRNRTRTLPCCNAVP